MFKKKLALAILIAICISEATAGTRSSVSSKEAQKLIAQLKANATKSSAKERNPKEMTRAERIAAARAARIRASERAKMKRAERIAAARRRVARKSARAREIQKAEKNQQYEGTSVLVETFLLRVSKQALKEAGVNTIGKAPDNISIPKLLWCLRDPNKAKVVSQMKVMTRLNAAGSLIKAEGTCYIENKRGGTEDMPENPRIPKRNVRTIKPYEISKSLEASTIITKEDKIVVWIRYNNMDIIKSSPRPTSNYISWESNIAVKSGVPVIAAAIRADDENINFIVLTATIQDQTQPKEAKDQATEDTDIDILAPVPEVKPETAVEEVEEVKTKTPEDSNSKCTF